MVQEAGQKRGRNRDLGTKIVFKGGLRDASVNHDKYYYEFEEAKMRRYKVGRKRR